MFQRAVHDDIAIFVLWIMVAFVWLPIRYFNQFLNCGTPQSYLLLAIILGVFFGAFCKAPLSLRELRIIEKKGEYRLSGETYSVMVLIVLVLSILVLELKVVSLQGLTIALFFYYPSIPAVFLTEAIFYYRWERKNQRNLYTKGNFFRTITQNQKIENSTH